MITNILVCIGLGTVGVVLAAGAFALAACTSLGRDLTPEEEREME